MYIILSLSLSLYSILFYIYIYIINYRNCVQCSSIAVFMPGQKENPMRYITMTIIERVFNNGVMRYLKMER